MVYFFLFIFSSSLKTIQITFQIQNSPTPSTSPLNPISPREGQSPDGFTSVSSGSSDANSGEFIYSILNYYYI